MNQGCASYGLGASSCAVLATRSSSGAKATASLCGHWHRQDVSDTVAIFIKVSHQLKLVFSLKGIFD